MKLFLLVVVSVALGVGLGVFTTWADLTSLYSAPTLKAGPGPTTVVGNGPQPVPVEQVTGPHAVMVISETRHDFGNMESGAHGTHDFTIRNEGDAPLTLEKGKTSCHCTLSKLANEQDRLQLEPGEETVVTLSWQARAQPGPFRQSAEIHSSDPSTPLVSLVVEGFVTRSVTMDPPDVYFTTLSPHDDAEADVRFYAMTVENFEIQGVVVGEGPLKDRVDVTYETLPQEELEKVGALGGYAVHLKIKAGLPLGPFDHTILLNTNLEGGAQMTVPVGGRVVSDITVVGRRWIDELSRLVIGPVATTEGKSETLTLIVRGPHRKELSYVVAEKQPGWLGVEIGETIERGNSLHIPVTVSVPKGATPAAFSGGSVSPFARVLIQVSHPDPTLELDEQLGINVSFVVTQEAAGE